MTAKTWAYEDFVEGASFDLGTKQVSAAEIVEFASEFDAQPMHLDEAAGKASILGGLSASGWHTCAMFMRMLCDAFLLDSTCQGAPGVDQVKWKKPVLAGDTLRGNLVVLAKRLSRSKPQLGFVTMRSELVNQRGESVFELENSVMFLTREASGASGMTLDEFFRIGITVTLGSHRFEPEAIKAFARKYDPQIFHIDEEAARKSVLGGLCASGWHTAATWMKLNLEARMDAEGANWNGPGPVPEFGPSPGFKDLKWLKPVYAGETVTFSRTALSHRPIASRPGWRMLALRAEAFDSTGDKVLEFDSAVLVKVE